jgi:hypothetical protein
VLVHLRHPDPVVAGQKGRGREEQDGPHDRHEEQEARQGEDADRDGKPLEEPRPGIVRYAVLIDHRKSISCDD